MNTVLTPESAPVTFDEHIRPTSSWMELGLVLFVAFSQPILSSAHTSVFGQSATAAGYHSNMRYLSWATQEIGALLVLWYVLSRSGRTFRDLGIDFSVRNFLRGLGLGAACSVSYYSTALLLQMGHRFWYGQYSAVVKPTSMFPTASLSVLVFFCLLNSLYEEIIVRGYVMTEIPKLTGSVPLAIGASVFIQASYHLYQGWLPVLSNSVSFLVLSIYYARTRRLLPVIIAHAGIDLLFFARLLSVHSH